MAMAIKKVLLFIHFYQIVLTLYIGRANLKWNYLFLMQFQHQNVKRKRFGKGKKSWSYREGRMKELHLIVYDPYIQYCKNNWGGRSWISAKLEEVWIHNKKKLLIEKLLLYFITLSFYYFTFVTESSCHQYNVGECIKNSTQYCIVII